MCMLWLDWQSSIGFVVTGRGLEWHLAANTEASPGDMASAALRSSNKGAQSESIFPASDTHGDVFVWKVTRSGELLIAMPKSRTNNEANHQALSRK
jgi:hypothetical protein